MSEIALQEAETHKLRRAAVQSLLDKPDGLDQLKGLLSEFGITPLLQASMPNFQGVDPIGSVKTAAIIDCETTSFDPLAGEIIEIAVLRISYAGNGIVSFDALSTRFNDPGVPIPPEIQRLTGITDQMVAGRRITEEWLTEAIGSAACMIAHSAQFDRKWLEAKYPGLKLDTKPWLCSAEGIDWSARGENSAKLELLALHAGFVYGSHRADSDVLATGHVLASQAFGPQSPFLELLETGRQRSVFLLATDAPFEAKDKLKTRGYHWSSDASGPVGKKCWWIEVAEQPSALAAETTFLREEVYRGQRSLPVIYKDAYTRYSDRLPQCETLSI